MSFVKEELAMAKLEDGDLVDSIYCFVALIPCEIIRGLGRWNRQSPNLG